MTDRVFDVCMIYGTGDEHFSLVKRGFSTHLHGQLADPWANNLIQCCGNPIREWCVSFEGFAHFAK